MILADKIIRLRKKNGWSQEELADKMNVSRQAVSKWEAAQSIPSLEKILQLSDFFGVTTDYLLKDEIENEEFTDSTIESNVKRITLEEANKFIEWRKNASTKIATAVLLCILSSIPLIILGAFSELTSYPISENLSGGVGVIILLIFIAVAVAIFVTCGFKNSQYQFLESEQFETEYGVIGMVKERQSAYKNTYIKLNIIATCLCVLSPIPLLIGSFSENEFLIVILLTVTMFIAGIGAFLFVTAGVRWSSMQKLLQEGEYSRDEKEKSKNLENIAGIYWIVVTAIYLGWSFITGQWRFTWIVWPIAGVIFSAIKIICNLNYEKKNSKKEL